MKYRDLMFAAAFVAVPANVSAQTDDQEVDATRVAELRCQLVGICEESVATEDGGIDGEVTRGASFRELRERASSGSTGTAPRATSQQPRRQNITAPSSRQNVGQRRSRNRVPAPGAAAVEVTAEAKGSADLFVTFARNSDRLVPSARQDIKELAAVLKLPNAEGEEVRLEIAGHTDASGSAEFNKELSAKRAMAVREALIAEGVKPEQLESVGYGEERLKDASKPNNGINRRVEAVVID